MHHLHLRPVLVIVAAKEEQGREIKLRAMAFPLRFLSTLSLCLSAAVLLHQATVTSGCFSMEREALLDFKAGIHDPHNRLSSWIGQDCCAWEGVICRATTGHVVELDLRNTGTFDRALRGERMNSSLLALSHLKHLDLSLNDFSGIRIPEFAGSFKKLRYLNLSSTRFMGGIPAGLGNLSSLYVLDLSYALYVDDYGDGYPVDDLDWLSHLSSLKHLDLSGLNLTRVPDWFSSVNMLPALQVLNMSFGGLDSIPVSVVHANFTSSLTVLDLSFNSFNSTLPKWLGNVSGLTSLGLSSCDFRGAIPDAIGDLSALTSLNLGNNFLLEGIVPRSMANLRRLEELDLSVNQLSGTLTGWLEQLTNLIVLNLSYNLFNGSVPASIGKFANLTGLYLGGNSLGGVISQVHLGNLTRLRVLDLYANSITVSIGQSWIPPFQLRLIYLSSCRLGPRFPEWLRFQTQTQELTMHDCKIAASIPNWFWNFSSSTVTLINLSNNRIGGRLPSSLSFARLEELYLNSNIFEGPLPATLPSTLDTLYLSDNSFTGQLPVWPHVSLALLSDNMLDGGISSSICRWTYLQHLILSTNNLFGEIPSCLGESLQNLSILGLANNHFSGAIPNTIGFLIDLQLLQLKNNSFSGELPSSLQNCTNLQFLDLAQNNFVGGIPPWMGENLPQLAVLRLRSNMFSGGIPRQLAQLGRLQILDLGNNNFSGSIPHSFGNFSTMVSTSDDGEFIYDLFDVSMKGQDLFFIKNLDLLKSLDLSNNRLTGEIPEGIGDLAGLQNLNLFYRQLQSIYCRDICLRYRRNQRDQHRSPNERRYCCRNLGILSFAGIDLQRNPGRLPSLQPRQRSGTLAPAVSGPANAPANAAPANAPGCCCFLPTHSRSKQSNYYSVSSHSSSILLRLAQQYRSAQPMMRFCSPSPLFRCCSSARCSVLSVLLCFPSQHIDTVDSKKSPSSALPQHIDTVAALPLLPIAIAARYFSIPESCGVPHLFAAPSTGSLFYRQNRASFSLFSRYERAAARPVLDAVPPTLSSGYPLSSSKERSKRGHHSRGSQD
ncbi:hypothetical protein BHE74_00005703 [Ensete ventricosum]|nr:hypothetical protein BHE74_00005703 [Ensete ventricosum]